MSRRARGVGVGDGARVRSRRAVTVSVSVSVNPSVPSAVAAPDDLPPAYQVRLDVFSGPLDLLLYLVRKEEVEIFDLSLERLTRQYLEHLTEPGPGADAGFRLDVAGEFVATAAQLLYLKSRRLLPPEAAGPGSEDGTEEELDPRWELVRQLLEYKKFKEVTEQFRRREAERAALFARPEEAGRAAQSAAAAAAPDPAGGRSLGELGVLDLIGAFQRVLRGVERRTRTQQIDDERFTVAEKIDDLLALVRAARAGGQPLRFGKLFPPTATRTEVVVTFLALLELVRLRRLRVAQPEKFGEIEITAAGE